VHEGGRWPTVFVPIWCTELIIPGRSSKVGHLRVGHPGLVIQGWSSTVGVPGLVIQGWSSRVGLLGLVIQSWSSKVGHPGLVIQGWSSRVGLPRLLRLAFRTPPPDLPLDLFYFKTEVVSMGGVLMVAPVVRRG